MNRIAFCANRILIFLFLLLILLPGLFAHREKDRVSDMENRYYANVPSLFAEDDDDAAGVTVRAAAGSGKTAAQGSGASPDSVAQGPRGSLPAKHLNTGFNQDFDSWIQDNVRGRELAVIINARLQYALFHRITKDDVRANEKNGDLFFASDDMVSVYQCTNRMSEEQLRNYIDGLKRIRDDLAAQGISFYYMQCYMKESIYPEYYFDSVSRLGPESVGRQAQTAAEQAGIPVIDIWSTLMRHKDEDRLYYKVLDPGHWNLKGAWLGYKTMIRTFQKQDPDIPLADLSRYEIVRNHNKAEIYGMTYPVEEDSDDYSLLHPASVEEDIHEVYPELADTLHYKEHSHLFRNNQVNNDKKILCINDSYIRMYIKNQLAESFRETMSVDSMNIDLLPEIVRVYHPDIVVIETAEPDSAIGVDEGLVSAYAGQH